MQRGKFSYCRLNEENVAAVARLEAECFPDPWSEKTFRDTLGNDSYITLVALCGCEIAGYINISVAADEANLNIVAVAEKYRRQGLAAKMIAAAETVFFMSHAVSAIHLEVRESNIAAISLYQKLGFETDGVRKNFYEKPAENAILMTKRLKK